MKNVTPEGLPANVVSLDAYRESKAEPIDPLDVALVEGRARSARLRADLDAMLVNGGRSSERDDARRDVLATVRTDVESNLSKLKAFRARLGGSESGDHSNVAPIFSDPLHAALVEGRAASVRLREMLEKQGVTLYEY